MPNSPQGMWAGGLPAGTSLAKEHNAAQLSSKGPHQVPRALNAPDEVHLSKQAERHNSGQTARWASELPHGPTLGLPRSLTTGDRQLESSGNTELGPQPDAHTSSWSPPCKTECSFQPAGPWGLPHVLRPWAEVLLGPSVKVQVGGKGQSHPS